MSTMLSPRRILCSTTSFTRSYATFVPPQSLQRGVAPSAPNQPKIIPASPNFYTARDRYYTTLYTLQQLHETSKRELDALSLLPAPKDIAREIFLSRPTWKSMRDTKPDFDYPVGVAKYKRLISVLDDLARIRGVARYAGLWEMYDRLSDAVRQFDTGKGEATVGERKRGELDAYGRSYAHSGRKTSSARAWMIPTDPGLPTARPQTEGGTPAATTSATHFLTSKILINSAPLSTYFTQTLDRERVVRPLRVTGLLGAFNIFALVRGGGTTGQADAVASAVARAIMLHAPQMKGALAEAGLLHRDPRMVERKKTNLLKAREARTWTKR